MTSGLGLQVFTPDSSRHRRQLLSRIEKEVISVVDIDVPPPAVIKKVGSTTASHADLEAAGLYFTTAEPGIVLPAMAFSMILAPNPASVCRDPWRPERPPSWG